MILVTGASSGIGEFVAKELALDGAHVILAARRLEKLQAIQHTIEAGHGLASTVALDVLDFESVRRVLQEIVATHGGLDGAFNNAGGAGQSGTLLELETAEFKRIFELNFYGTYHCMKAELEIMTQQKFGSIVNNLSMFAKLIMPLQAAYCASKHALLALQNSAAAEAAASGVRVNSVSPGFCRPSESLDGYLQQHPDVESTLASPLASPLVHPSGAIVHASDVYASVALLLDGKTSGAMTGADLPVTGGHGIPLLSLG